MQNLSFLFTLFQSTFTFLFFSFKSSLRHFNQNTFLSQFISGHRKTLNLAGNMRGFMCHPAESTMVCTVGDSKSVIVPRFKSDRSSTAAMAADGGGDKNNSGLKMLMTTSVKYSKLVDSPLINLPNYKNRSSSSSSLKKKEGKIQASDHRPKLTRKPPLVVLPSTSSTEQLFQVVVMRVSIHCQGCAGKLKKHLSKMEGVTSFSIELEAKRVTVMGNVSPIGVLESISKIKRAEFWPIPIPNSS